MTIQGKWMTRGMLWGVVLIGFVACAVIANPPEGLIAKNDHMALATWYEKEAAHLRLHAKEMAAMAEEYRRNPGPTTRGVVSPKIDFLQHCESLVGMYTRAAAEAELLALGHRDLLK
ncbi:MAG: hypothetical protein RI101_08700 [Nitrospira sp.]|jgi:hypothetical protein|nr:hypothetical protein [Nitrospira sp.]